MSAAIKADVDRGLEICNTIEKLEVELKLIEERLKAAGLSGEQVDLVDADREGKQFLAAGTERIVPIIFTADKLVGEFLKDSPKHQTLRMAAHGKLTDFFKPVIGYKNRFDNGKKFRIQAEEILGVRAPAFITACIARDKQGIPKSDIKVCWGDAAAVPERN